MLITQFIRDRSDVELERLSREGTLWHSDEPYRRPGDGCDERPGCLLCNAFDLRSGSGYDDAHFKFWGVENFYMDLAVRNGETKTGAMIARLARRELGHRALAAIGTLSEVERTPEAPRATEVGA